MGRTQNSLEFGATSALIEIAAGKVLGYAAIEVLGRNPDLDLAAAEDLRAAGGLVVQPTTARIHALVSGDAADDEGSTGLEIVRVHGVNAEGALDYEDVTLNGTGAVNTLTAWKFIHHLEGIQSGSGDTNAGIITATAAIDSTVTATIALGRGSSEQAAFLVPDNQVLLIMNAFAYLQAATAATTACNISLVEIKADGTVINNRAGAALDYDKNVESALTSGDRLVRIKGGSLVKIQATTTDDDTFIVGGFSGVLIPSHNVN